MPSDTASSVSCHVTAADAEFGAALPTNTAATRTDRERRSVGRVSTR
jgi:hypothetical protein